MISRYSSTSVKIPKTRRSIRYFELTKDMFADEASDPAGKPQRSFDASFEKVVLRSGEYLDPTTNLANLNPFNSDTTVLNFQVGTGKTQVLFNYIAQYITAGSEYTVFYCAPFLRLLNEITRELNKRSISYFDCTKISSQSDEDKYTTAENFESQVQLMTPDFLLSSGGRRYMRQSSNKQGYRQELRDYLGANQRKVVLIVDEIHEKPAVFASQYLPSLMAWNGLVHKTFIASATFTQDSVQVCKAVSFLTKRRLQVFQAGRVKGPIQARLHLHVCSHSYGEKDLNYLAGLAEVIQGAKERPIHILTAFKSIAKKLAEGKGSAASDAMGDLVPKPFLLTAENKTPFDETRSSIGTTFKTGVNIKSAKGVLVAVLPGLGSDNNGTPNMGTFTDIRSSVVQAFARLRNGGDIHVFMPPLTNYIRNADHGIDLSCTTLLDRLGSRNTQDSEPYLNELQLLEGFKSLYAQRRSMLEEFKNGTDSETVAAYDALIQFEGLYDYLLSEYTQYKDSALEASGQGLAPLVLWMALNEQFTNCSLETITIESYIPLSTKLPNGSTWAALFQEKIHGQLISRTFTSVFEAIESVLQLLEKNEVAPDEPCLYEAIVPGKGLKQDTIRALHMESKVIATAIFNIAEGLVFPTNPPKKREKFLLLVEGAKEWDWTSPSKDEDYYSMVQRTLRAATQEVINMAKEVGSNHYLPEDYESCLSYEAARILSHLMGTLEQLVEHDSLTRFDTVYLPGFSNPVKKPKTEPDFRVAALQLIRQQLGLVDQQLSRKSRADIFGTGTKHYTLKL